MRQRVLVAVSVSMVVLARLLRGFVFASSCFVVKRIAAGVGLERYPAIGPVNRAIYIAFGRGVCVHNDALIRRWLAGGRNIDQVVLVVVLVMTVMVGVRVGPLELMLLARLLMVVDDLRGCRVQDRVGELLSMVVIVVDLLLLLIDITVAIVVVIVDDVVVACMSSVVIVRGS